MKLKALARLAQEYVDAGHGEEDVCIALSNPALATRAFANICSITPGFDSESGRVWINPVQKIYTKQEESVSTNKWSFVFGPYGNAVAIKHDDCGYTDTIAHEYCPSCGCHMLLKSPSVPESKNQ